VFRLIKTGVRSVIETVVRPVLERSGYYIERRTPLPLPPNLLSHQDSPVQQTLLKDVKLRDRSIRLFLAMHAPVLLPESNADFAALGLGGFRPVTSLTTFTDDTGDSISSKNVHYSELTGWYWLWKNMRDLEVIGLCHYRRYFLLGAKYLAIPGSKFYVAPTASNMEHIAAPGIKDFVNEVLTVADVIVPRRQNLDRSLTQQYLQSHPREDWDLFLQAIRETCPDFRNSLPWFDLEHQGTWYNMMIAPKAFLDAYMARLFAVTDWMERQKPFRTDFYQCRVPAFIAERFFAFYLHVTRTRRFEVPVAILDKRCH
jgi:hypothetical protein